MELNFNNGKKLTITSATAGSGIMTIRMLQQNLDDLQKIFSDELGTKVITVQEDGKEDIAYENYTKLNRISVYTGQIFEVELRQKEASTDTKIADNTAQLTETQEAIADIYARLDAIDEQLAAKSEKEVTE
ncbi:MAG: hypothetical protein SPL82_05770 [Lachnospiraceae bacterium]|nr:hypothetical protein [Lachnospiraceae bacterium]